MRQPIMDETQQFRDAVKAVKEHEGQYLRTPLDHEAKDGKKFRTEIEELLNSFNPKFLKDIRDEEKQDIVKTIDRAMDVINDKGAKNLDQKWVKKTTNELQGMKKNILANM